MKNIIMQNIKLISLFTILIFSLNTNSLPKEITDKMDKALNYCSKETKPYLAQTFQLIAVAECYNQNIANAKIKAFVDNYQSDISNMPEYALKLINSNQFDLAALTKKIKNASTAKEKWSVVLTQLMLYAGSYYQKNDTTSKFAQAIVEKDTAIAIASLETLSNQFLYDHSILLSKTGTPIKFLPNITKENIASTINLLCEKRYELMEKKFSNASANPDKMLLLITQYELLNNILQSNQNGFTKTNICCGILLLGLTMAVIMTLATVAGAKIYFNGNEDLATAANNAFYFYKSIAANQTNAIWQFLYRNCTDGCPAIDPFIPTTTTTITSLIDTAPTDSSTTTATGTTRAPGTTGAAPNH